MLQRGHADLAAQQAHDRERDVDAGDVGDQPAVGIAQRHAAQRQVITAKGEPLRYRSGLGSDR